MRLRRRINRTRETEQPRTHTHTQKKKKKDTRESLVSRPLNFTSSGWERRKSAGAPPPAVKWCASGRREKKTSVSREGKKKKKKEKRGERERERERDVEEEELKVQRARDGKAFGSEPRLFSSFFLNSSRARTHRRHAHYYYALI